MSWLYLVLAIGSEVGATLSLRMANTPHGGPGDPQRRGAGRRTGWFTLVALGYGLAFWMLYLTLGAGMPLGVAYGLWAATGVALVAVAGRVLFAEPFTWVMAVGVACIVAGVLLVETGATHSA